MIPGGRTLATLAGGGIGAYQGLGWVSVLNPVPLVGEIPFFVPVVLGALFYGVMGYRYGEFGLGFAVFMLFVDTQLPPGAKRALLGFAVAVGMLLLAPLYLLLVADWFPEPRLMV